jgi:hypothetical protein
VPAHKALIRGPFSSYSEEKIVVTYYLSRGPAFAGESKGSMNWAGEQGGGDN